MSNDLIILLGILVLIGLLFFWVWLGMQSFNKRLRNHARSIDKLMQANYELSKKNAHLKESIKGFISSAQSTSLEMEQINKSLDAKINEAIASKILPMIASLKRLEDNMGDFASEHNERMYDLEKRTENFSKITPPSFEKEEDYIVDLYKSGKSIESIAKDLHITLGRVEMVLRFRKLL